MKKPEPKPIKIKHSHEPNSEQLEYVMDLLCEFLELDKYSFDFKLRKVAKLN